MSKPNPAILMAILIALLVVLGGAALLKGGFYLGKHEGDTYHMIEIVLNMAMGERPHIDFMTPIGEWAFAPIALFSWLGFGIGMSILWAQILVAALFLLPVWWVGSSRLTLPMAAAFSVIVMVLILALVHGESERSVSISMHYNRWAWAAAFVAIFAAILPPAYRKNAVIDGVIIGAMLSIMVMIKVTYFLGFVLPIGLSLILTRQTRALAIAVLTGILIFAAITLSFGVSYWQAYVGDLITVATSGVRPQPGEPLSAVVGSPAYLGASMVAVMGVILLRQAGAMAGGLVLLTLLPGFFYVTFQNFGNDPQWLPLLGLILLALRPRGEVFNGFGWNMRNAVTICGAMALAMAAPSFFNLAYSPFRHLRTDVTNYTPLFLNGGINSDIQTGTIRAVRVDTRIAMDEDGMPFAAYRDDADRDDAAEIMGETFAYCSTELGLPAFFQTMADDLTAAGYGGKKVFMADLFSSALWMFGDFGRLEGATPWYYGGLPGYGDAEYLMVPICPITPDAQARILKAVTEDGTGNLTEVRRNDLYILFAKSAG